MIIGNQRFMDMGATYIMGILNVTPDSFSDGGKYNQLDQALFRVEQMIDEGCDILDIGAESTHPGYSIIPPEEELERLLPFLRAIRARFDIPISIDTYKSAVAKVALEEGADMINDIWGLKYDPDMALVIASYRAACCLMHNRREARYQNLVNEVVKDMEDSLQRAIMAGIRQDGIMLDPGIGFGKTLEQNLTMIKQMQALHPLGVPLLLGTSRKSVIGKTLDLPVDERLEGTIATTVMAVMKGYSYVRVHDIKENKRAIDMTYAILNS